MRARLLSALLVGLAITPLIGGCGEGTSPETRATETLTALYGTETPDPLEVSRTSIALGTFTGIDPGNRVILTAEAFLPVSTPVREGRATRTARNEYP